MRRFGALWAETPRTTGQIIEFCTTFGPLTGCRKACPEYQNRPRFATDPLDRTSGACYTGRTMKADTHPTYYPKAKVTCACGNSFTVGSVKEKLDASICSECHP